MALSLYNLGYLAQRQGDHIGALRYMRESLALWQEVNSVWGITLCLAGFAAVTIIQAQQPVGNEQRMTIVRRGIRLFSAAGALREAMGGPLFRAHRAEIDRALAIARSYFDEGTFARTWADGQTMSLEQAIACMLDEAD